MLVIHAYGKIRTLDNKKLRNIKREAEQKDLDKHASV